MLWSNVSASQKWNLILRCWVWISVSSRVFEHEKTSFDSLTYKICHLFVWLTLSINQYWKYNQSWTRFKPMTRQSLWLVLLQFWPLLPIINIILPMVCYIQQNFVNFSNATLGKHHFWRWKKFWKIPRNFSLTFVRVCVPLCFLSWGQFHQHVYASFYMWRFQKCK